MPQLKFKATDQTGKVYSGVSNSENTFALARELREKGDELISAEEVKTTKTSSYIEKINSLLGGVKTRDEILFTRNLSAMVSAGLTISRGLEVMERQTRNKKFKEILGAVQLSVQKGNTLSVSLSAYPKVFSELFISMVKAGEESGKLAESLENLGVQMEKAYQLKKRIRGAMFYPGIVITAMIIVGVVMLIFVVPTLSSTFDELGVELPTSTRLIIGISNFIQHHSVSFVLLVIIVIAGIILLAKNKTGKRGFEWAFLHTPVIRDLVRFTNSARTARTLSSLLNSGVEIIEAVNITKDVVQNSYFRDVLVVAGEQIPKGGAIADAFNQDETLFPPLVGEMISVGEETGNLPEMLHRVADFYESEVDERTKNLSTIIEPILMILIGSVVGFFAVSMISPIYSISAGL